MANNTGVTVIVGLGETGLSVLRYCAKKAWPARVYDSANAPPNLKLAQSAYPNVPIVTGRFDDALLKNAKQLVVSPGVANTQPIMQAACEQGIPIIGDIELFARACADTPIVAITGTNGKSTVTQLCGLMLQAHGFNALVGGNIGGAPALDLLDRIGTTAAQDVVVLELSSFQLEKTDSLKPHVATILNISADHLDRHGTYAAYVAAKQRIYRHADIVVCNADDPQTLACHDNHFARHVMFCAHRLPNDGWGVCQYDEQQWLANAKARVLPVASIALQGAHHIPNALAAMAIVDAFAVSTDVMRQVLSQFSGLAHRAQVVANKEGVLWVNDSKATNASATIAALHGFAREGRKIILIAGGDGKGADLSVLREPIKHWVKALIVLGKDGDLLAKQGAGQCPVHPMASLRDAVLLSHQLATGGDVVLLSPACASTDMFSNYKERGNVFTQCVKQVLSNCTKEQ